jgi:hypothetical protein
VERVAVALVSGVGAQRVVRRGVADAVIDEGQGSSSKGSPALPATLEEVGGDARHEGEAGCWQLGVGVESQARRPLERFEIDLSQARVLVSLRRAPR